MSCLLASTVVCRLRRRQGISNDKLSMLGTDEINPESLSTFAKTENETTL